MNEKDLYNKTIETIFKDIEELKEKLTFQDNLSYISNIEDFKSHMSKYAESFDPNKKNEVPKELLEILPLNTEQDDAIRHALHADNSDGDEQDVS